MQIRSWSKFDRVLYQAAQTLALPEGCRVTLYSPTVVGGDLNHHNEELIHDVEVDALAGLIFITAPFPYQRTPILDHPGIPRVAISEKADYISIPRVYPDFQKWYEQAVAAVMATGRRRVAAVLPTISARWGEKLLIQELQRHGLKVPMHWIQHTDVQLREKTMAIERTMILLLAGAPDQRPDVLVVADDNLLDPVLDGVTAAGLRIGHDVMIVTHCNFPWPKPAGMPVIRVGFNAPTILECCFDSLAKQRRGEALPEVTLVPPIADSD